LSTLFIYKISTYEGQTSITTMLLAGIAIAALAGAITGLMTYFSEEDELRNITFWTLGSLASGDWITLLILGLILGTVMFQLLRLSRQLDIMSLGEQEAYYIGIDVQKIKRKIIILVALIVGPCVAVTGLIGFIALVVPHLMRSIGLGKNHRQLILSSAIGGAILLVIADSFARTLIAPSELPIGILTALIGGPYFLWLLHQSQKEFR
jgi:iron complex transport system permease protein